MTSIVLVLAGALGIWLASPPAAQAQTAPTRQFDDTEAQLRVRQAANAASVAAREVEALRKALETERQRVVQTDGERDLNQVAIKTLENDLRSAEARQRERDAELKIAQEARSRGLAVEAERRRADDVQKPQANPSSPAFSAPIATAPAPQPPGKRFMRDACGRIVDRLTNLDWYVGPDRDLGWLDASAWVASLQGCGGGWAMPRADQVAALFDPTKTAGSGFSYGGQVWPAKMDPIFSQIGGGAWVWLSGEISRGQAPAYNMNQNLKVNYRADGVGFAGRAFAVRVSR